jgi:CBS domain-containing protein
MTEFGVNRLPVVKDNALVGIVTRTDLVRAFVRSDEEIERELRDEVIERTMWLDGDSVHVDVKRGAVSLAGTLRSRSDVALLERMTARIPGVVAVTSDLKWTVDDTTWRDRHATAQSVL